MAATRTKPKPKPKAKKKAPPPVTVKRGPIRLNIGGTWERPGWVLIDRNVGKEAYPLTQYADGSVDEVRASHILEHFPHKQVQDVVNEWARVLKPGGVLRIAVPDFKYCAEKYLAREPDNYGGYVMGGQQDENDFHKSMYDEAGLRLILQRAGLISIVKWDSHWHDCAAKPVSLNLQGVKPPPGLFAPVQTVRLTRLTACAISLPRSMPSATFDCVLKTCVTYGIHVARITGAYWHQCIDRAISEVEKAGFEWLLTVDGDSVFKTETFARLATLFEANPQADALACMQMGREKLGLLMNKQCKTLEELDDEVTPVNSAHFGLTLFRVSAFKRLKRPWFKELHAPDGTFGDGRRDADMWFWDNWRECGNTVYIAPRVPLGHLEEWVVWPGEDLQPVLQNVNAWISDGVPEGARR